VSADAWHAAVERLVVLLAPATPHLAEELWHRLGHVTSVHLEPWPTWDEALTVDRLVTVVIQVNGKVRDQLEVTPGLPEQEVRPLVLERPRIRELLDGKSVRRFVYVPDRLVNLVAQ